MLERYFGGVRLNEITIGQIEQYQNARLAGEIGGEKKQKAGPVCINHEMTVMTQILKRAKLWKEIDEHYKPLRIPPSTRGCALSSADEERLFRVMGSNRRWRLAYLCSVITANTTAGPGEILHLRLRDLNLEADPPTVHIREGIKNKHRDRFIPLNEYALKAFRQLVKRATQFGATRADHYLLPARVQNGGEAYDPTRPMRSWRRGWEEARKEAGLPNLRMYDLRHHAITSLLEKENVAERTVTELAGHVSRQMLERYSHIRMSTKKQAVDALVGSEVAPEPAPKSKPPKPAPEPLEPLVKVHREHETDPLDVLRSAVGD
jgi:hypothetical protein